MLIHSKYRTAAMAMTVVAANAEVRHFVEGVIDPGQEDVIAGEPLKRRREIDVPVDVLLDVPDELRLASVFLRRAWEQERAAPYEIAGLTTAR